MNPRSRSLARAVAAALGAALIAAGATGTASARDLAELRAQAQSIADEVTDLEQDLAGLTAQRTRLDDRITEASREIGLLEGVLHETRGRYAVALEDYVDTAVMAYKSRSSGSLDLLLSARTLAQLQTIAKATNASTEAAATAVEDLLETRDAIEAAQAEVDEHKQSLIASRTKVVAIEEQMSRALAERSSKLRELNKEIALLEARLLSESVPGYLGSGPAPDIPPGFVSTGVAFEGIASWYGPGFEGNSTANGEIFDSDLYTAASKELPFGTWLHVTFQGRGVVVVINDRGPYIEGRIIDLSRAAAEAIGMTGIGWVRAEIIVKT